MTESTMNVTLVFAECEFLKELSDQTAVEGKQAAFECVISKDDGKVTWFAGERKITSQACLLLVPLRNCQ